MSILRVSEVYTSIQGEGPRVGEPTVFVRFGGCNLRCPGWPCDTQHAIDPKYRAEWIRTKPYDLAEDILSHYPKNICLTGGEPFLQNDDALEELVGRLQRGGRTVECFSNGAMMYPDWAPGHIRFVMDWKLTGSGEGGPNSARSLNFTTLCNSHLQQAVKFTIADQTDFMEAYDIWRDLIQHTNIPVYAGVVWGKLENEQLVGWILANKLPWKLTVQIHNYVWNREQRGI